MALQVFRHRVSHHDSRELELKDDPVLPDSFDPILQPAFSWIGKR
jgi:hypothetical protein